MIYENVELHNVAEVRSIQGRSGVRLQRVPEDVRLALNEGAQMRLLQPDNAEVRFVADSSTCHKPFHLKERPERRYSTVCSTAGNGSQSAQNHKPSKL